MLWSNSSDSFRSCGRYVESIFIVKDQALTLRWDLCVVPERRQQNTNQHRLSSQNSEDLNCTAMEGQNLAKKVQVCRVWRCVAGWVVPEISRTFLRNGNHSFTHLQPPEDLNAHLHRCEKLKSRRVYEGWRLPSSRKQCSAIWQINICVSKTTGGGGAAPAASIYGV